MIFQTIYEYIAFKLLSPNIAKEQIQRIYRIVRSLDEMQLRFKLFEDEPLHSKGLQVTSTDHYLILYLPKEVSEMFQFIKYEDKREVFGLIKSKNMMKLIH